MKTKHFLSASFAVIFTITSLLFFSSCQKSAPEEDSLDIDISKTSVETRSDIKGGEYLYEITPDMALEYVKTIKNNPVIVSEEAYEFKGVACFYIFNFEKGWMAVAADSRVQSILGESEYDNLYLETLENEGVKSWLELTANFIYHVKVFGRPKEEINSKSVAFWDGIKKKLNSSPCKSLEPGGDPAWVKIVYINTTMVNDSIPHLLETKWGQHNPWNTSLPISPVYYNLGYEVKFVTGCVPTAISQVLYYFHNLTGYPSDLWHQLTPYIAQDLGYGKYKLGLNKSDYNQYSTRWDYMQLTLNGSGNASYVSDLMMDVGVRMNATYSVPSTGASLLTASDLTPCGFTGGNSYYYSYSTVKSNLMNLKPVFVIAGSSMNSGDAHAWVIDGFYDRTYSVDTTTIYYTYEPGVLYPTGTVYLTEAEALAECPNIYDGWSSHTNYSETEKYLYMNYGWNGLHDDGHYTIETSASDWANNYNVVPCIIYNLVTGPLY